MINTRTGGLRNKKTSGDYPNYSIIEIGLNTEKSPGDLRRHNITQTPVKDYQLTPIGKTLNNTDTNWLRNPGQKMREGENYNPPPKKKQVQKKPTPQKKKQKIKKRGLVVYLVLRPCQRTNKAIEPEGEGDTNWNWHSSNDPQWLGKGSWWKRLKSEYGPSPSKLQHCRVRL